MHLLEGPEILTDVTGLTSDLIHPADEGMIQMGRGLAERRRPCADHAGAANGLHAIGEE